MALSSSSSSLLHFDNPAALSGARIAIVSTEWNEEIVAKQVAGCDEICNQVGAIVCERWVVPGAFELPFAVRKLWEKSSANPEQAPEAIIVFGAVIRGGTPHFEYVCQAVTQGVSQLNLTLPVPVIFGVLTLDTIQQALERLGGEHGHKGQEAAIAALKMIALCK